MKVDLLKCQNCRFRAKVDGKEKTGRIQVGNNCIKFWFDYHDELNDVICHSISMEIYSEYGFGEFFDDLEIVPRNPKTYKDWQVGDKMERISEEFDSNIEVVFRSGEFVVCKTEQGYASINYLCDELFNEGYRLVLTDIEKQIIEGKMKSEYKPQDGDICYAKSKNGYGTTFIYRQNNIMLKTAVYAAFDDKGKLSLTGGYAMANDNIEQFRPATDGEKQRLFDALAKLGKRWNAEKKCVEDIPKPYEFRKGEPVLVRDDGRLWVLRAYIETENGFYAVTSAGTDKAFYRYCLPYNESTMRLLGTTEDYKVAEQ